MKLLLVGCGNMGKSLLSAWVKSNTFENVVVVEPSLSSKQEFVEYTNVEFVENVNKIAQNFTPNIILFAVKPQIMDSVIPEYKKYITNNSVAVSIAAGLHFDFFEKEFGADKDIVRIMPNLAVKVLKGVCLGIANHSLSKDKKMAVETMFEATGALVWTDNIKDFDTMTVISGCGPAYFFLLTESMIQAGVKLGLSEKVASELATKTFFGAAAFMESIKDKTPGELQKSVASKGGVTQAALDVLDTPIKESMEKALQAGLDRSKELGKKSG
jgi:pyrroline-5-carboxylate reductase